MASKAFAKAQHLHSLAEQEFWDACQTFNRTADTIKRLDRDLKSPTIQEDGIEKTNRTLKHYEDVLRNQRRDCEELKETFDEAYVALSKARIAWEDIRGTPAEAKQAKKAAEAQAAREAEREDARRYEEKRYERFEHTTPPKSKQSSGDKKKRKQKSPTTTPKTRERKGKTPKAIILDWRIEVDKQLANYSAMTSFPSPPSIGGCVKDSCVAKAADRILVSCDCQIEAAFDNAEVNLKVERLGWHPDKFAGCTEEKREEWGRMAGEVFRVVNGMFEVARAGE